ncbi:MAG: hypothetical protein ABFE07_28215 [Armatimonadia bacterium]
MTKKLPFVAIGADELGGPLGTTAHCNGCGQRHPVKHGEEVLPDGTTRPSDLLAYVKCPATGNSYLVGIKDRELRLPRGG